MSRNSRWVIHVSSIVVQIRVKCNEDDTIGDLKKLVAAQTGTREESIGWGNWFWPFLHGLESRLSLEIGVFSYHFATRSHCHQHGEETLSVWARNFYIYLFNCRDSAWKNTNPEVVYCLQGSYHSRRLWNPWWNGTRALLQLNDLRQIMSILIIIRSELSSMLRRGDI